MVSGGGTNLQALIDACQSGNLECGEIKIVISNNKNAYAIKRAENSGIKTETILKTDCQNQQDFENRIAKTLSDNGVDLVVLAGFMSILSENFTSRYKKRILNVHPSLIPSFCGKGFYGLKVHEAALSKGVKITGATVHYVNEIPDGGEIIMQKSVDVLDGDTPETLQKRVMEEAEWKILPESVRLVCRKIADNKEL